MTTPRILHTNNTHYIELYNNAVVCEHWEKHILAQCKIILANKERYLVVSDHTNIPWQYIAGIHYRESSLNFQSNLVNGEPYNQVTRLVPRGLGPWSSWEHAAIEGFIKKGYANWGPEVWDNLALSLNLLERWNGTGYLKYHSDVFSPYLWNGCCDLITGNQYYISGGYKSDGTWDQSYVNRQAGIVAILKSLNDD